MWNPVCKWLYNKEYCNLFIGAGLCIGKGVIGVVISNLFIGFEKD